MCACVRVCWKKQKKEFPLCLAPLHAHLFALRILLATPPKKPCAFAVDPKGRTTESDRGGGNHRNLTARLDVAVSSSSPVPSVFFPFSLRIDAGGETTKPDARIQTEYFTDLWNDSVILHAYFFFLSLGVLTFYSPPPPLVYYYFLKIIPAG